MTLKRRLRRLAPLAALAVTALAVLLSSAGAQGQGTSQACPNESLGPLIGTAGDDIVRLPCGSMSTHSTR